MTVVAARPAPPSVDTSVNPSEEQPAHALESVASEVPDSSEPAPSFLPARKLVSANAFIPATMPRNAAVAVEITKLATESGGI